MSDFEIMVIVLLLLLCELTILDLLLGGRR